MRYRYPVILALVLAAGVGGFASRPGHHLSRAAARLDAKPARSQRSWTERPSLAPTVAKQKPAVDALLGVLDDPGAGDETIKKRMVDGYFQLLTLLRKDPSLASYIEERLANADREDPATQMMVGALSGSGVPEAQEAMIHLLDRRRDDDSFMTLLVPAMGFAVKPTDALQSRLEREMDGDRANTRSMSTLAMGVMAARVSSDDPSRAARIVADYDRRMHASDDASELRTDLSALGNAGTPEVTAIASRYLDDDRPDVRANALQALRRVDDPAAETSMLNALSGDVDESVRESALRALSERQATPAALDTYANILSGQASEPLALGIVDQLGYARDRYPDRVRALLVETAENSPSKQVRERARALLAKNDSK